MGTNEGKKKRKNWGTSCRCMGFVFVLLLLAAGLGCYITIIVPEEHATQSLLNSSTQQHQTLAPADPVIECLKRLPAWVDGGPTVIAEEIVKGSQDLTDKTTRHHYQYLYHRYMSLLAKRTCQEARHHHNGSIIKKKLRILEIGLGCGPMGGMLKKTPGGSALAWRHLFGNVTTLDLHMMEFDAECANKWAVSHKEVAMVHTGDAFSEKDLDRVYQESGALPFDVIIDDASHVNELQIKAFTYMIQHVAEGGLYIIEDIFSSCKRWKANTGGVKTGQQVLGTSGCMTTSDGKPTIFSMVVEWQKELVMKKMPFPGVTHIDLHFESVVFEKQLS